MKEANGNEQQQQQQQEDASEIVNKQESTNAAAEGRRKQPSSDDPCKVHDAKIKALEEEVDKWQVIYFESIEHGSATIDTLEKKLAEMEQLEIVRRGDLLLSDGTTNASYQAQLSAANKKVQDLELELQSLRNGSGATAATTTTAATLVAKQGGDDDNDSSLVRRQLSNVEEQETVLREELQQATARAESSKEELWNAQQRITILESQLQATQAEQRLSSPETDLPEASVGAGSLDNRIEILQDQLRENRVTNEALTERTKVLLQREQTLTLKLQEEKEIATYAIKQVHKMQETLSKTKAELEVVTQEKRSIQQKLQDELSKLQTNTLKLEEELKEAKKAKAKLEEEAAALAKNSSQLNAMESAQKKTEEETVTTTKTERSLFSVGGDGGATATTTTTTTTEDKEETLSSRKAITNLQERLAQVKAELEGTRNAQKSLQKRLADERNKAKEKIKSLETELQQAKAIQQKSNDQADLVTSLQEELEKSKVAQHELNQQREQDQAAADQRVSDLQRELEEVKLSIVSTEEYLEREAALNEQIRHEKEVAGSARKEITKLQDRLAQLKGELDGTRNSQKAMQARLESERQKAKEQVALLEKELNEPREKEVDAGSMQEELENLRKELEESKAQQEEISTERSLELKDREDRISALEKAVEEKEQELERGKEVESELNTKLESHESEIELKGQLISDLESKVLSLEEEMAGREEKERELTARMEESETSLKDSKDRISELEKSVLAAEVGKVDAKDDDLIRQEVEAEMSSQTALELKTRDDRISELEKALEEKKKEVEQGKEIERDLAANVEEALEKIKELEESTKSVEISPDSAILVTENSLLKSKLEEELSNQEELKDSKKLLESKVESQAFELTSAAKEIASLKLMLRRALAVGEEINVKAGLLIEEKEASSFVDRSKDPETRTDAPSPDPEEEDSRKFTSLADQGIWMPPKLDIKDVRDVDPADDDSVEAIDNSEDMEKVSFVQAGSTSISNLVSPPGKRQPKSQSDDTPTKDEADIDMYPTREDIWVPPKIDLETDATTDDSAIDKVSVKGGSTSIESSDYRKLSENGAEIVAIFKNLDADGNGVIDLLEFEAGFDMINAKLPEGSRFEDPTALFEALDADCNGVVDVEELEEFIMKGDIGKDARKKVSFSEQGHQKKKKKDKSMEIENEPSIASVVSPYVKKQVLRKSLILMKQEDDEELARLAGDDEDEEVGENEAKDRGGIWLPPVLDLDETDEIGSDEGDDNTDDNDDDLGSDDEMEKVSFMEMESTSIAKLVSPSTKKEGVQISDENDDQEEEEGTGKKEKASIWVPPVLDLEGDDAADSVGSSSEEEGSVEGSGDDGDMEKVSFMEADANSIAKLVSPHTKKEGLSESLHAQMMEELGHDAQESGGAIWEPPVVDPDAEDSEDSSDNKVSVKGLSTQIDVNDYHRLSENGEELLLIFKSLDADGNGELDLLEFEAGFDTLNEKLPEGSRFEDPTALFEALDADGNGVVDMDEFESFLSDGGFVKARERKVSFAAGSDQMKKKKGRGMEVEESSIASVVSPFVKKQVLRKSLILMKQDEQDSARQVEEEEEEEKESTSDRGGIWLPPVLDLNEEDDVASDGSETSEDIDDGEEEMENVSFMEAEGSSIAKLVSPSTKKPPSTPSEKAESIDDDGAESDTNQARGTIWVPPTLDLEGEGTDDDGNKVAVEGLSTSIDATDYRKLSENGEELLSIFQSLDADGNGEIDLLEFEAGFDALNEKLPEGSRFEDPTSLFEALDADGNGTVDMDEFKAFLSRNPESAFVQADLEKKVVENEHLLEELVETKKNNEALKKEMEENKRFNDLKNLRLQRRVEELEKATRALKEVEADQMRSLSVMETDLSKAQEREAELEKLREELEKTSSSLKEAAEEREMLKERLESESVAKVSVLEELSSANSKLEAFALESSALRSELEGAMKEREELNEKLEISEKESAEIREELVGRIDAAELKVAELESVRDALKEVESSLRANIDRLENDLVVAKEAEAELERTRDELAAAASELIQATEDSNLLGDILKSP